MSVRIIIFLTVVVFLSAINILSAKDKGVFIHHMMCENPSFKEEEPNLKCLGDDFVALRHEYPYSVNLLWINEYENFDQQYIFPENDSKGLMENFLFNVMSWAEMNPKKTLVNIWYDGGLISEEAVENTRKAIELYTQLLRIEAPILLKDIRSIAYIQSNPHIINPKLSVYFRADLIRMVVLLDEVVSSGVSYALYSDIDNKAISHDLIYDDETLENLEDYGIVLAYAKFYQYENSFQIISHHNKNLLEAIRHAIIEVNTERASWALSLVEENEYGDTYDIKYLNRRYLDQIVHDCYRDMFKYFYYLEGKAELWTWEGSKYDPLKHGIGYFGTEHEVLKSLELKTHVLGKSSKVYIPTKKVNISRSHFGI